MYIFGFEKISISYNNFLQQKGNKRNNPEQQMNDFKNIPNRKYYDFYRDLRKIIGKMRDLHLSMAALYSPNGYDLSLMDFCLPFSFYIKGENSKDAKIYI